MRKVYFNGKFIDECDAKISIYDSALMYGDMVFEMTRTFNKKQFKLMEHLERLYASMKYLHIPITMSIEQMEQCVYDTMDINQEYFKDDDEHRIMIDITRGLLPIYQNNISGIQSGINVIIADYPLRWTVSNLGHLYDKGVNAVVVSQRAIPAQLLEPKVKNRSRIHYLLANIQASQMSGEDNWPILLDQDGFITEGPGDNVFIVKDGVVITPEGRNVLRGISRAYIFELCTELQIPCIEKNIEQYDFSMADEAFMTATPFCMIPTTKFNGQNISDGYVGPITTTLLNQWSKNVGVDIAGQIKSWKPTDINDGVNPYEFKR